MSYITIIPVTKKFYRSAQSIDNLPGYWFGFTPNDTYNYGNITAEFNPVRELKLIDITSHDFYNEFTNKLLKLSELISTIDEKKDSILFPLGYVNIDTYRNFCNDYNINYAKSLDLPVQIATQFIHNRSRHSIKEADINLMNYLRVLYPNCDGIISQVNLPNIVLNGYHHAEIGLFDPNLMSPPNIIQRIISGGAKKKIVYAVNINNPALENDINILSELFTTELFANAVNSIQSNNEHIIVNKTQQNGGKMRYRHTIRRKRTLKVHGGGVLKEG